jgi:L-ascorbate metabolism protein UlaG (beta-lactamase superfamily)
MRITKFRHACVTIQTEKSKLVIDPGVFSTDFQASADIRAVVITHVHRDHCDPKHLEAIIKAAPQTQFFGTQEVAEAVPQIAFTAITGGQTATVDDIVLAFYGGEHAIIHQDMPRNQNIGVMVNERFYYPGDSFVAPDAPITILALPVSAPWLKISETMDFLNTVRPQQCFATHNAILSSEGQGIVDGIMGPTAQKSGIEYLPLQPGQSLEI